MSGIGSQKSRVEIASVFNSKTVCFLRNSMGKLPYSYTLLSLNTLMNDGHQIAISLATPPPPQNQQDVRGFLISFL